LCTAPAMADSLESCAHCGKQGVGFKRCSRCKQASYCGAACQNANWKRHKKKCAPPVPLQDVAARISVAQAAGDWKGVLKWEGRLEELVACQSDDACLMFLSCFSSAHLSGFHETGCKDHARSHVGLVERCIPFLGKLQRFWDQGESMCSLSSILRFLDRDSEAATWYQRARDVGAAHGFFSLESTACMGLGTAAVEEGRHEEGVALLRNALVAAELNELDNPEYEIHALQHLIYALFSINWIDKVEPLVLRYREAAKAQSGNEQLRGAYVAALNSLLFSARLHEVLCLCAPRWKSLLTAASLLAARPSRICHRVIRARDKTHAPVEPESARLNLALSLQARGKPQEAAMEVRALLDLMHENEALVQKLAALAAACASLLELARRQLTILDPEVGEEELVQAVAAELARLRALSRST